VFYDSTLHSYFKSSNYQVEPKKNSTTIIVKGQIPNNFSSSLIKGIINAWYSYMRAVHYANGYPIYDVKEPKLCSDKNTDIKTIFNQGPIF